MRPGASGLAEITAGKPASSPLFQRLASTVESVRMPQSDDALSPAQIALIRQWIVEGAKFDGGDPTLPLKSLLGPRQHPAAPSVYRIAVPVMALAFAPGGREIAVGGYNEVTFWNIANGELVRRIQHLPQRIQAVAFSQDGKSLLVAGGTPGEYGELARVDLLSGERAKVLDTFNDIVLAAAFSADGRRVVAGCADGSVRVYEWESGRRAWLSKVHSDWVTSVSFSPDGRFVASASKDMTVKVYEAPTGTLYTTYNGHNRQIGQYAGQAPVYAVQFASDSGLAYSAGGGRWIQIWSPVQAKAESGDAGDMEDRFARENKTRYLPTGFEHEVFALAVHDGQIFAASADGLLKQFDGKTFNEVRTYRAGDDWLFAVDYDAATHRVATGSYNGEVSVWNTQTGERLNTFKAEPGAVH
jgi:WD40 repeat protein